MFLYYFNCSFVTPFSAAALAAPWALISENSGAKKAPETGGFFISRKNIDCRI